MRLRVVDSERCVGCQSCMFACTRLHGEGGLADACLLVRSIGGLERGFTVVSCNACENPPCLKVCPTGAISQKKEAGVRVDYDKCTGCGFCKSACIIGAVFWNEENNKPMICSHCGFCSKYCPHGVLTSEKDGDEENVKQ